MKIVFLLLCFFLVGCSNPSIYDTYVKALEENENISLDIPFDIEFYIDSVNENRLIYQVIIDNPQIDASNVKALVIHNGKTDDIFPSVGIVDNPINLNFEKGIILLGYANKVENLVFKVLIEVDDYQYIYRYNYWQKNYLFNFIIIIGDINES